MALWQRRRTGNVRPPSPRIRLTLYTRPGCHLCEEMKAVLNPVAAEFDATVEEVDISTQAELEHRYGTDIPVLLVNDRKAFKYRLQASDLRRRLEAERRSVSATHC